jgi:hypothetical protein
MRIAWRAARCMGYCTVVLYDYCTTLLEEVNLVVSAVGGGKHPISHEPEHERPGENVPHFVRFHLSALLREDGAKRSSRRAWPCEKKGVPSINARPVLDGYMDRDVREKSAASAGPGGVADHFIMKMNER